MSLFVLPLFYLLISVCFGNCSKQHMVPVCTNIDDVDDIGGGIPTTRLHGTPGKRGRDGMKGDRGLQGMPGVPGIFDNERLEERVRVRVDEEIGELKLNMIEMEERMKKMTKAFHDATCRGIVYDRKCYWAVVHLSRATNFAEAQQICNNENSELADIYSKDHYDQIMHYLRSHISDAKYIYVWTGMKKKFRNVNAFFSNGTQAPYTKPRSSAGDVTWDQAEESITNVYILAQDSRTAEDQGLGGYRPTGNTQGALCQTQ